MNLFDKIYFKNIIKKIKYVVSEFNEVNIKITIKEEYNIAHNMRSMHYIDDFIDEFFDNAVVVSEPNHQNMLKNFFFFFFYSEINKRKFYWTAKDNNLNLKSKIHSIPFNNKKRSFYYDFLDEFKFIPNYNFALRKILLVVL
ncbi:hypothetical protein [Mycoplasmopsis edwardii]|uniref:Uncharacterized protein n=1 Tax=Mycoplasmopsis edwardii TaxID=53558 RepID=A0ACD4PHA2_9BACT|nr:hypothetical protein [Mycoplasmopsis edwardii]WBP83945.1 hypothetical protein Me_995_000575 [Mycoplasmopsis edwardii]